MQNFAYVMRTIKVSLNTALCKFNLKLDKIKGKEK